MLKATGTNPVVISARVDYGGTVSFNDSDVNRKTSGTPGVFGYVDTTSAGKRAYADDFAVRDPNNPSSWFLADSPIPTLRRRRR